VACETPQTLRDRRLQCRNRGQPHVGRTCSLIGRYIADVILDPLCQDLSNAYAGEDISAHVSLRRGELCPYAVRYDQSSLSTIADILILAHIWSSGALSKEDIISCGDGIVIIKAAYIGVRSRWMSLSAPHTRTLYTGAILDGRVLTLLVRRHIWLESGGGKSCSRWDLENEALR
jgi:hypothetical protein